jgi:hypothetical protein
MSVMTKRLSCGVICIALGAAFLDGAAYGAEKPAAAAARPQRTFATERAAADALIAAAAAYDIPALKEILGPDSDDLIVTDDPVQDKNQLAAFARKADEKNEIVRDDKNPNLAILNVGDDQWPMPIPIVRKRGVWSFDTKAGERELLYRRVGRNELDAIEICQEFVDAQRAYSQELHDGAKVNQYAQRNISTPGKHDGLAWLNADGSWGGPLGDELASAIAEGYTVKQQAGPQAYHGYYFKVLKGQGPAAPLGAMDFVVKGMMIGGFALAAAPSDYRVTGVKTFIVSHDGIVYEKDLGPKTPELFRKMDRYNPDKTWTRTELPSESDEPTAAR